MDEQPADIRVASPSIRHERAGNAATAIVTKGKRPARSLLLRVIRRTAPVPSRAIIRKPSCLIS